MKFSHAFPLMMGGFCVLAGCDQHPKQDVHPALPQKLPEAALPRLDGLIRFSEPQQCGFSEQMERLLESLIHINADYTLVAGEPAIPPEYAAAFGRLVSTTTKDHLLTVTLPVRGTWKGLRVVTIGGSAMPESDVGWNTIRFAATKQAVIQKLNEAGMALPSTGQKHHADPDDPMELVANVTADGPETILDCS